MRYYPVCSIIFSFDFFSNYSSFIAFIFSTFLGGGGELVSFFLSKRDLPKRARNFEKYGTDKYMT